MTWHEDDCRLTEEYKSGNFLLDLSHIEYLEMANLLSNYIVKEYIQKINIAIYDAILNFKKSAKVELSVDTDRPNCITIYDYFIHYLKKRELTIVEEKLDWKNKKAILVIGWK